MGIPKFYRYLSERYPLINEIVTSDEFLPECDYLYLDMNGVIHNATHDNSLSIGVKSDETIANYIMGYVSHIVKQMKPAKLLFMAVDGVAPRAKLNQQRSRRFRSATDMQLERTRLGYFDESFDSNCITPGTEFMDKVDTYFQYLIHSKISSDPLWRDMTVLYSSHRVPGEGEHKIMSYIRYVTSEPKYERKSRHCVYGLDADLILLSLSLHDVNLILLREVINFLSYYKSDADIPHRNVCQSKWQILHLSMLRYYLTLDLYPEDVSWFTSHKETERIIDDFVMLMIIIGNDFLPELPSLDINEGSVQYLMDCYKQVITEKHRFIVNDAKVDIEMLQCLFRIIGKDEEKVFADRAMLEEKQKKRFCSERRSSPPSIHPEEAVPGGLPVIKSESYIISVLSKNANYNYRTAYYFGKMNFICPRDNVILDRLCQSYYEGIQWVMDYYYRGISSWSWYFPFHYSPLASDLASFAYSHTPLDQGKPFTPFLQQLGCLPPQSSAILPRAYRSLVLDEASPLIQFYPQHYAIDMNGKKNPWEGVNLIPFIDEERMMHTVAALQLDTKLTTDEVRRNTFISSVLCRYDAALSHTYPSPIVCEQFPEFLDHCREEQWSIPSACRPQEDRDTMVMACDTPRVYVNVDVCEADIGIQSMGRASKQPTIVLDLTERVTHVHSKNLKQYNPSKLSYILYGMPYMHVGLLTSVSSRESICKWDNGKIRIEKADDAWRENGDRMEKESLYGRFNVVALGGVDITGYELIATIVPLTGVYFDVYNESIVYDTNAKNTIVYPYDLCGQYSLAKDDRYNMDIYSIYRDALQVGKCCVILKSNQICIKNESDPAIEQKADMKGCICRICAVEDTMATVEIIAYPRNQQRRVQSMIDNDHHDKWYSMEDLSRIFKISRKLAKSLLCYHPISCDKTVYNKSADYSKYMNLLNIFLVEYIQCSCENVEINPVIRRVPYCPLTEKKEDLTRVQYTIYCNKDGLALFNAYRNAFPSLLNTLNEDQEGSDGYTLFGDNCKTTLRTIEKWIESQGLAKELRCYASSSILSTHLMKKVSRLQKRENHRSSLLNKHFSISKKSLMPWEKHGLFVYKYPSTYVPSLGSYFVVIRGNDLPFGKYGYVVGVHMDNHQVEVVMEEPFIGGTDLYGSLDKQGRGGIAYWEECYFF